MLIACVNIAGLLFARGATRTGEMAIRASLGAGRFRLIRQLLIESLALAIAGGAAGVLLASISLDGLLAILPIRLAPGTAVSINARVLIAATMDATATGIAFGLVPAMRSSRARIGHAGRLMGATFSRRRGQWLMATQIALTVALLAGAGLMTRSFGRLLSVDLGFDPGAVIAFKALPVGTDLNAQTQGSTGGEPSKSATHEDRAGTEALPAARVTPRARPEIDRMIAERRLDPRRKGRVEHWICWQSLRKAG